MFRHSKKTAISLLSAMLLMQGCGGNDSTTTLTLQDTNLSVLKVGNISRSGSTQGGGSATGDGVLEPYTQVSNPLDGTNKKLIAIYMIGSDLERKYNSGTSDLNEIIAGYQTLTQSQKDSLDIFVAFGGANKDGWRGMKFATIPQIINDAQDKIFGNEVQSDYSYSALQANMGHVSSLNLFLKYIKNNYANHATKFVDLWDHGSGYGYFLGNDDYYAASSNNTHHTYDLNEAFVASELSFDLIGYDTCLNNTMEVAKATQEYSKYLLASEELEPGHGWNYSDVIKEYAKDQNITSFATALVDSFIDSPEHKAQEGKTLALVDLSKYTQLNTTFEQLSNELQKVTNDSEVKNPLIQTLKEVRAYNQTKDGAGSMDVKHFAELLSRKIDKNSPFYPLAQNVINAVNQYVIYSREDGTRPHSNGVAIAKLDLNNFANIYGDLDTPTKTWLSSMKSFAKLKADDVTPPVVQEQEADTQLNLEDETKSIVAYCATLEDFDTKECLAIFGLTLEDAGLDRSLSHSVSQLFGGERASFIARSGTRANTIKATLASFDDAEGNLADVKTLYGNIIDGQFLSTAILDATKRVGSTTPNQYYTPNWNQKWYTTLYNDTNESAWIPMIFQERKLDSKTNSIVTTYVFEVDYIDGSRDYSDYDADVAFDYAQIEVVLDQNNTLVSHRIKPYTVDFIDDKEIIKYGKTAGEIKVGDQLRFYSKSFDMNTKDVFWNAESDFVKFDKSFNIAVEDLFFEDNDGNPLDYYYLMVAEDINDNKVYTDARKAGN